jgi:YesN/AraC family two-component response regulator
VVQMKENFLGPQFFSLPEMAAVKDLFERAKGGLAFHGKTKRMAGEKLKQLTSIPHFEQLITLLQVFHLLANSAEVEMLKTRPIASAAVLKEQQRLQLVYHFIEANYQNEIDVNAVAKMCHLTTAAFCRYFKKCTHYTFTDFVNQFRINQSKKLLHEGCNVTEACYQSGFANISYYNRIFKKITGENPSAFRRKNFVG